MYEKSTINVLLFRYNIFVKKNDTGYNYSTKHRNVQLLISEEFAEKIVPKNDSVRLLDEMIEEMDLTSLYGAYEHNGRNPATSPDAMLKILIYANMEGIYSSREIESSCKRDINFI